jgi:hypothetical protein
MRGHIVSDRLLHRLIIQSLDKKSFNLFISFIAVLLSLPLSLFLFCMPAGPVLQQSSSGIAKGRRGPFAEAPGEEGPDELPVMKFLGSLILPQTKDALGLQKSRYATAVEPIV